MWELFLSIPQIACSEKVTRSLGEAFSMASSVVIIFVILAGYLVASIFFEYRNVPVSISITTADSAHTAGPAGQLSILSV